MVAHTVMYSRCRQDSAAGVEDGATMDARAEDRRTGRSAFHYPERRTGFDRRYSDDPIRALVDRPIVLVAMLIAQEA